MYSASVYLVCTSLTPRRFARRRAWLVVQEAIVSLESRCTGESTSGGSSAGARARRKLRARGNGFCAPNPLPSPYILRSFRKTSPARWTTLAHYQIQAPAALRVAAGQKGKVGSTRASSSIGRGSSRAAGLFPVGGRSGSAAGLLPFGGVSGPAAPLFPISGGNGEHQHRPHPWLHPAWPNPPLSAASLATVGASLIISRCF